MDPDVQRLISRAATPKANMTRGQRGGTANSLRDDVDDRVLPYVPAKTTNPARPRSLEWYYLPESQTVRVIFRDGTKWEYYNVPQNIWRNLRRSPSPGRYINRVLNNYAYGPGDW